MQGRRKREAGCSLAPLSALGNIADSGHTPAGALPHAPQAPASDGDPGSWIPETKCLLFVLSADQWERLPIVGNL